jgi:hypothetical protein
MFFLGTYVCLIVERHNFFECLSKGGIVSAVVLPLANAHYGNPEKYRFRKL